MKPRIKRSKWKGPHLRRMAKLIEFKPSESDLFEALTVIFFAADHPSPAENKVSIKAEDIISKHGVETKDSKFKPVQCPFCEQRVMINPRILTLPEGQGADIILEDKVFEYVHSRFEQWKTIVDSRLKRPFEELRERFEDAKKSKLDDFEKIQKYLQDRDAPPKEAQA